MRPLTQGAGLSPQLRVMVLQMLQQARRLGVTQGAAAGQSSAQVRIVEQLKSIDGGDDSGAET